MSIYKAITVKYLGPTNSRGARVKASAGGTGNVTLPFRHEWSMEQNVAAAVDELLLHLGWGNPYALGVLPDGGTYVAVLSDKPSTYLSTSRNEEKQNG